MSAALDMRWWNAEKGQTFRPLAAKMRNIREAQRPRRGMYKFFAELYGGQELGGLGLSQYDSASTIYVPPSLPFNVTRNGVETVVNRVANERPLPQVLTNADSDYTAYKRARRMTQAIEGGFNYLKIFTKTPRCARDAATFGTGILQLWREDDEPCAVRIFPWEICVDMRDAVYGDPRCIYVEKWYDKGVLKAKAEAWGASKEALEAIDRAQCDSEDAETYLLTSDERSERVRTIEAYHLRSSKKSKDGVHAIIVDGTGDGGADLLVEPYNRDLFPFAFLNYKDPLAGFWGDGLAAEMAGYQAEINQVAERVRMAHYTTATGMWLVPNGSDVLDVELNNDVGPIVKHKLGFKPEHINPEPVAPQTYGYLLDLHRMAPEDSGLNQQTMSGQKPAGIIAAKALQSIKDQTSERGALFGRNWDQFHVDIGELLIDIFGEIAEEHGDFTLRTKSRRGYKEYVWKDVSLPRDAFTLETFATSMLAKTPAGRLQQVYDLFNAKVISRVLFLKLLDAPDVDAETDLESAPALLVDEQISHMLDADDPEADDAYQAPLPLMDLTYALHRALCQWAFAKLRRVPPENLELLVDYIEDVKTLIANQNDVAPADAGAGAPPPAPAAPGGAPPPQAGPGDVAAPPGAPLQ